MIVLGIESSCDDTAAAIVSFSDGDGKKRFDVLSDKVSSQIPIHALYGGVVPEIAGRAHAEAISSVVDDAVSDAGVKYTDIDAVAVTFAPGLIGSLLVGVSYAKALAYSLGVPLVPVNHIEAHAAASYPENPDLTPPALALIVSGGHTSFYSVKDDYSLEEIGGTRDDAAGEAFDKVGRVLGLSYPGGAALDALAAEGMKRDGYKRIVFPSPAIPGDGYEFSFSGLKTAAINHIHNICQKSGVTDGALLPDEVREDIAAALTSAVVRGIGDKLRRALIATGNKYLILAGGVAANSHLRAEALRICDSLGRHLCVPSKRLCGDNGVMTASAGALRLRDGDVSDLTLNAYASDEAAREYLSGLRNSNL